MLEDTAKNLEAAGKVLARTSPDQARAGKSLKKNKLKQ